MKCRCVQAAPRTIYSHIRHKAQQAGNEQAAHQGSRELPHSRPTLLPTSAQATAITSFAPSLAMPPASAFRPTMNPGAVRRVRRGYAGGGDRGKCCWGAQLACQTGPDKAAGSWTWSRLPLRTNAHQAGVLLRCEMAGLSQPPTIDILHKDVWRWWWWWWWW